MPIIKIFDLESVRESRRTREVVDDLYPTKNIEVTDFRCANPSCSGNVRWRSDDPLQVIHRYNMRVNSVSAASGEYWITEELFFCSVACAGEALTNLETELKEL